MSRCMIHLAALLSYFNELLSDIRDGVAETDFYQYQAEERQGYVLLKPV